MKRPLPLGWIGASVFAVTVIAYLPSLSNSFVNLDEEIDLIYNPHIRDLGWENLKWMWTTFHNSSYQPLCWMLFAAIYKLRGLDALTYHLASVLLHGVNAVFVFSICHRLFLAAEADSSAWARSTGAAFGALLFALHPAQVLCVASASATADLLSITFALAASWLYLARSPYPGRLTTAWFLFACSALTRWQGVVLPVAFLLLNVYPLRRLDPDPRQWRGARARAALLELAPFAAIALGTIAIYLLVKDTGAESKHGALHPLMAAYGLAFFLKILVWPIGLLPIYVLEGPFDRVAGSPALGAAAAAGVTAALLAARKRWPAGLSAWLFYAAALAPPLLVSRGGRLYASLRYSYLPYIGFFALAGAAVVFGLEAWRRRTRTAVFAPVMLAFPALLLLAAATRAEISYYSDPVALWTRVLSLRPNSLLAHDLIAKPLMQAGRIDEGLAHFKSSLEINPNGALTRYNYGVALYRLGRFGESASQFREAVRLDPSNHEAKLAYDSALKEEKAAPGSGAR
ncbi:MAG: tetratricopeptide repeat protein [Elusimicrobia bacterium]|nr:tetratricopeptide repeat protein [Elusimicrobiota bacterium]